MEHFVQAQPIGDGNILGTFSNVIFQTHTKKMLLLFCVFFFFYLNGTLLVKKKFLLLLLFILRVSEKQIRASLVYLKEKNVKN